MNIAKSNQLINSNVKTLNTKYYIRKISWKFVVSHFVDSLIGL